MTLGSDNNNYNNNNNNNSIKGMDEAIDKALGQLKTLDPDERSDAYIVASTYCNRCGKKTPVYAQIIFPMEAAVKFIVGMPEEAKKQSHQTVALCPSCYEDLERHAKGNTTRSSNPEAEKQTQKTETAPTTIAFERGVILAQLLGLVYQMVPKMLLNLGIDPTLSEDEIRKKVRIDDMIDHMLERLLIAIKEHEITNGERHSLNKTWSGVIVKTEKVLEDLELEELK